MNAALSALNMVHMFITCYCFFQGSQPIPIREKSGNLRKMPQIREKSGNFDWPVVHHVCPQKQVIRVIGRDMCITQLG